MSDLTCLAPGAFAQHGGKRAVPCVADCVFWTTLLSAVTVTLVLAIVKVLGGGPLGGL